MSDHISKAFNPQLSTVVAQALETTVTTVPSNEGFKKGSKYAKVDALYEECSDLVNPKFHNWYCQVFFALGDDMVRRLASTARQEAKKDQRLYFSWLLKNPDKV